MKTMWSVLYIAFFVTVSYCANDNRSKWYSSITNFLKRNRTTPSPVVDLPIRSPLTQAELTSDIPPHYPVTSQPYRGRILIINLRNLPSPGGRPDKRYGSEIDVENLESTFWALGYKGIVKTDEEKPMTRERLLTEVRKFAMDKDQKNLGAAVVAIMSHGDEDDRLITANCDSVSLEEVKHELDSSKYLRGKPKFLIVEACRGCAIEYFGKCDPKHRGEYQSTYWASNIERCQSGSCLSGGVVGPEQREATPLSRPEILIRRGADYVVARSSLSGNVSYRNKDHGSWFVSVLCSTVQEFSNRLDVVNMLYRVTDKMSREHASDYGLAICETTNTLNKPFYL